MSEDFVREISRENLCTHLVLPLLKLNKFSSFVVSNTVNSYLTRDGAQILVQVMEPALVSRKVFLHENYRGMRKDPSRPEDGVYLLFEIPRKWKPDVQSFMQGRFSRMSKAAKDMVIRHSGLKYQQPGTGGRVTDARILALERHPLLARMWERMLSTPGKGYVALKEDDELLSVPGDECYKDPDCLVVMKKA